MSVRNYELSDEYSEYRLLQRIAETASEEIYDIYAEGQGPLTLEQLDPELVADSRFLKVADRVGWPTEGDAVIEPVHKYQSTEDFVTALRYSHHPHFLNNFNAILRAEPAEELDMHDLSSVYGIYGVVHRANVVAPDLFGSIRELFQEYKGVDHHHELNTILEENEVVAEQIWKAFKIMGRLVTTDDYTNALRRFVPDHEPVPIVSAQDFFYT